MTEETIYGIPAETYHQMDEKDQEAVRLRYGAGGIVEEKYNEALQAGGNKLWAAIKKVGGEGFGKGALITGILAFVGAAIGFSALAATGSLHLLPMGWSGPVVGATVEKGIELGLGVALHALIHPIGWAALATGGLIGAGLSVKKEYHHLAEGERILKECGPKKQVEIQPQVQPQQSVQQNVQVTQPRPPSPVDSTAIQPVSQRMNETSMDSPRVLQKQNAGNDAIAKPEKNFCSEELKRRASAQAAMALGNECKMV